MFVLEKSCLLLSQRLGKKFSDCRVWQLGSTLCTLLAAIIKCLFFVRYQVFLSTETSLLTWEFQSFIFLRMLAYSSQLNQSSSTTSFGTVTPSLNKLSDKLESETVLFCRISYNFSSTDGFRFIKLLRMLITPEFLISLLNMFRCTFAKLYSFGFQSLILYLYATFGGLIKDCRLLVSFECAFACAFECARAGDCRLEGLGIEKMSKYSPISADTLDFQTIEFA